MNSVSITFVISALLLFFSANLPADDAPWYHVEIIVFEQLTSKTDEKWPVARMPTPSVLTPQSQITLMTSSEKLVLQSFADRLQHSSDYQLHYHRAWQQAVMSKDNAKKIQVLSDNGFINGDVKLYQSTYVYAAIDLWLRQAMPVADTSDGDVISYPNLKTSQRIKKDTLHFFDHPKVGVLLIIKPVPAPIRYDLPIVDNISQ